MSLQGMIEEMGLGEVIQALSLNRHRGTLRIEGDEGISKFFYLSEGEIVLIRTVKSEPVRIGELLIRAGKIDHEQLDTALTLQKESGQRLGDALIALGHVTSQDVEQVVRQKFEEEFLDVFLLDKGTFEFIFGLSPESLFSPDEKLERIALNTSSLMLEAMRRVDDWQGMLKVLGSLDDIYRNRVGSMAPRIEEYTFEGVMLPSAMRREVYELLDGRRSLREVLAASQNQGASRLAVFQFLHALKQQDLIRPLEVDACLAQAKETLEAGDAPATAKFIRAVMVKERVEISLVRRYIEFLRKSARPAFARRECKVLAAQYLAAGEIEHAIALYEQALEIDRRDVEVLDRLFYAHLRKSDLKKAIEVGFNFRDYMNRESDLPIVARVVKNLRELAADDPRVLEISGLLLLRQERIDEARRELEKALDAVKKEGGPAEREVKIMDALLEIDPERSSLARERERVQKEALVAAEKAAMKRRMQVLTAVGAAIILALLAFGEVRARRELSEGESLEKEAKEQEDVILKMKAAQRYREAATRISTVGLRATGLADALDREIAEDVKKHAAAAEALLSAKKRKEDEDRAKREAEAREKTIVTRLAAIDEARAKQDWGSVVKLSLALHDEFGAVDERVKKVTMPVRVATKPAGAKAWIEGVGNVLRTPCVLEAPIKTKVRLVIAKPGFTRIESTVDTRAFNDFELPLTRGPAWKHDFEGALDGSIAASPERVVGVGRDGRMRCVRADDGDQVWERLPAKADSADALGDPAPPAIFQNVVLQGGRSGLLLGIDLETGKERWRLKDEAPIVHSPVPVEVEGRDRALVARGNALEVVDFLEGKRESQVALPAAAAAAPIARKGRAVVVLVDGRVCAIDLAKGKVAWNVDAKVDPVGPAIIAADLGVVLAASREGTIVALALSDGGVIYRQATELGTLDGGISIDESKVYVGTTRGRIAALSANNGRALWETTLGSGLAVGPRRFGPSLYVALRSGELVALAPGDGRKRGLTAMDAPPTGTPAVAGERLVVGAGSTILAFESPEEE